MNAQANKAGHHLFPSIFVNNMLEAHFESRKGFDHFYFVSISRFHAHVI